VKTGPELALAASARAWPDRLHRFLIDHGGGRVRTRIMSLEQAVSDQYEVLFIDDVCSFLTPRLVRSVRELGREIVGVYNPVDAHDAKRHLLECGITDVIEEGAAPDEFLAIAEATLLHRGAPSPTVAPKPLSFRVGVLGPIGGVGCTEVAIGIATNLSQSRSTLLIDLDDRMPSVTQRLDLPIHPNLLTALEAAHHAGGSVTEAILDHDSIDVIGGLVNTASGQEIPHIEIEGVLDEIGKAGYEVVVADLGSPRPDRLEYIRFHVLIVVGLANPVGIARLVRSVHELSNRTDMPDTVALVNRVAAGSRRRLEIRAEMARLLPTIAMVLVPEDSRLERASWDGTRLGRGPFAKSVSRVATLIDGVLA
jgi:MinD-like ATPase involved in chromosome partitioning or flagellar assembly